MPHGTSSLGSIAKVSVQELKAANVPPGISAADVEARLSAYRAELRARQNEQMVASRARFATLRWGRRAAPNP